MSSNIKKSNVDINVELIRIISCFLVIMWHSNFYVYIDKGIVNPVSLFVKTFSTSCVTAFFLISGFFIYNKTDKKKKKYLSILKSFFIKIFIPVFITEIIIFVFNDYLMGTDTLINCLNKISFQNLFSTAKQFIIAFFKSLIITKNVNSFPLLLGHLWYVYSYFVIILVFPIIYFLNNFLSNKIKIVIALVFMIIFFALDITNFLGIINEYKLYDERVLFIIKPIVYSCIGTVFYNNILKKQIDEKVFIIAVVIYLINFISQYYISFNYFSRADKIYDYTNYQSFFSLISTLVVMVIIKYLYNVYLKNISFIKQDCIIKIANKTFMIYIIHPYVMAVMLKAFGDVKNLFFTNNFLILVIYDVFLFVVSYYIIKAFECILNRMKLIRIKN